MKLPTPIKTDNVVPWHLFPFEMVHTLSMECVSSWINLLSLYYDWLMNSFLYKAKNSHSEAVPRTCLIHGTWPSSCAPLSFLQHYDIMGNYDTLFFHFAGDKNEISSVEDLHGASQQWPALRAKLLLLILPVCPSELGWRLPWDTAEESG